MSNRTEKATPRRQRELRKRGVVARSAELPGAVALLALVLVLPLAASRLGAALREALVRSLAQAPGVDVDGAQSMLGTVLVDATRAIAPVIGVVALAGVATAVVVTRARPNPGMLAPKWERISPKSGVRRIVSPQSLADLARAIGKLGLLGAVAWLTWRAALPRLVAGPGSVDALLDAVGGSVASLVRKVAAIALLVGVLDAAWARHRYNKQARMTKDEVREEMKTTEGNPHVKAAIRARQAKLSRTRMIAAVAKADVVLANPTHIAIALAYQPGSPAPVVVAKGAGVVAEKIKAEAAKHGVEVVENRPLARALFKATDVGDLIPEELYRAVAEVLALVYATRRGARKVAA